MDISDSYFSAIFDKEEQSFRLIGNRRKSEIIKQNNSDIWIMKLKDEIDCLLETNFLEKDEVLPIGRRDWSDCNSDEVRDS